MNSLLLEKDSIPKLIINGHEFKGWRELSIHRSMEMIAGTFDLTFYSDQKNTSKNKLSNELKEDAEPTKIIQPGERCTVQIGDQTVITGFIDGVRHGVNSSGTTLEVYGRDQTADCVDCSSLIQSRVWNQVKLETLSQDLLKPFGISFLHPQDTGPVFPSWSIHEESVFENLVKAASLRGLILISDGKGSLVALRAGMGKLSEEKPFLEIHEQPGVLDFYVTRDFKNRFSHYQTRGANYGVQSEGVNLQFVVAPVLDSEIKRFRPLLIAQEGETRKPVVQDRLTWEKNKRRAQSEQIQISVLGWRDSQRRLFTPTDFVSLNLPSIGVSGKYLLISSYFTLDDKGPRTHLHLERRLSMTLDPTLQARESTPSWSVF